MAEITAKMVAQLRASTGLGMMECKKALVEADGDMEKAEEILRIKSGAKAGKLAGRTAAEGVLAYAINGQVGALVEVNCETDFVAKDESFLAFAQFVADQAVAHQPADVEALSVLVEQQRKDVIAKLGENISVRRFEVISGQNLTTYLHSNPAKEGVLVAFEGDEATANQVAMQIVAMKPQFVKLEEVDADVVEKERHIYTEQVKDSNKPQEILNNMVEGRIKKFLAEVVLYEQTWLMTGKGTVSEFLKGQNTNIIKAVRYKVGDGIEKKEVDYAAEVAAAAKV